MDVRVEFLVEPLVAGQPGPHVEAAVSAISRHGAQVSVGPFASEAAGPLDDIAAGVAAMFRDAFAQGATRVSVVLESDGAVSGIDPIVAFDDRAAEDSRDLKEFLAAVRPVAKALGATVVKSPRSGDVPLRWRGAVVAAVRPTPLTEALDHMITSVEREMGGPLSGLGRNEKQQAVALLHERGAFALRRSTDAVAESMKVSRITIYNYLNALESS